MRKSLIVALTALGSGASYGAGVTRTGPALTTPDPATWRWHVSSILNEQRDAQNSPTQPAATNLGPLYQRYTALGLPQRR